MEAKKKRDQVAKLAKTLAGPCMTLLERRLQESNIKRQNYHSQSFVGNHIHKMVQVTKESQDESDLAAEHFSLMCPSVKHVAGVHYTASVQHTTAGGR